MLRGCFDLVSGPRRSSCLPEYSWTEPPLSKHANYIGPQGARVVVIQPNLTSGDLPRPIDLLFSEPRSLRRGVVSGDARRISLELRAGDALSSLSIDALVACMLVTAARLRLRLSRGTTPPTWLVSAAELVREHFREPIGLAQIAATIGVDRSMLAHAFRRHFRRTMGDYLRGLRLDWAVERLTSSKDSITEIALAAGFADQSHLTRVCTRHLGISPGALRRLSRHDVRTLRNRLSPV
jgi:AraC family transcriptional regulator